MNMQLLTKRQSEVFDFIRDAIATRGMPPTVAEIAVAMRVSSTNGIRGHLQALARKGVIELIPGASRGIRLLKPVVDGFLPAEGSLPADGSPFPAEGSQLPIVGRVAAGDPILAEQHIEGYCQVDVGLFRPKADFLLRVYGLSMRDIGILDGDLLVVHKTVEGHSGQVVVARLDDEVTVKRLRLKGHRAYLQAENPDFETIVVDLRHTELNIEGLVVGVIRSLN